MEVSKLYMEFLLKLLNSEENQDIYKYQKELTVSLYLTLLSLSNIEYSEDINQKEKDTISDFLRKLNNLKVKIQLKRKPREINKLAEELITQYYENINILSIYIKDGIELENVINTMDAKSLTKLIDSVTKDKMNKEYSEKERNIKRAKISKLLPTNHYYIDNNTIFIKNDDTYEELQIDDFIEMFNYLLNPDNYKKIYKNRANQKSHESIISNIIKVLIVTDKKQEELKKVLIPIILTQIASTEFTEYQDLDTSKFNIENIKISELYSLASKEPNQDAKNNTPKWRNISIPNEYLLEKIYEMIIKGMYYFKEENFVFEHTEENTSDFKISIKEEQLEQLLKTMLEINLNTRLLNEEKTFNVDTSFSTHFLNNEICSVEG